MFQHNRTWQRLKNFFHRNKARIRRRSHFEENIQQDQAIVFRVRRRQIIPTWRQLKYIRRFYSETEVLITKIASFLILVSIIVLGVAVYNTNLERIPAPGGEYIEAMVGVPTYINPLYAQTNDIDQDLSALLFSGLMRIDENGEPVPDLAERYTVNDEHTTYTFTLKPDLYWHDGVKLTAHDIIFTVQSIKDQNFRSPLYITFSNIQIALVDERTVSFTLPEPFAPFLSVLTVGILPEHLWQDIDPSFAILAELNLKPVGSGPYQFLSLSKDKKGNIREYKLKRSSTYHGQGPHIETLTMKFFATATEAAAAVQSGNADGIGYIQKNFDTQFADSAKWATYTFDLPQYTALFFNQESNPILTDKNLRLALGLAISKHQIIDEVFDGSATPVDGPIPPSFSTYAADLPATLFDPAKAAQLLDDAGWRRVSINEQTGEAEEIASAQGNNTSLGLYEEPHGEYVREKEITRDGKKETVPLEVRLTTIQKEESIQSAQKIRAFWQNIGVTVNVEIAEISDFQKNVIKPRAYEILLFGQILGRDPDPYPFWHSSQVNNPGLNLALYRNKEIDLLLEDARHTSDQNSRKEKYIEFQKKINSDVPALFLYSLNYTYIIPSAIQGVTTQRITKSADRFSDIPQWFMTTKKKVHFDF